MTKKISELKTKIDTIVREYEAEYEYLAYRSDKSHGQESALIQDYKALDAKTGLNALYEQLTELVEKE